jgi:hypothetical protein
VIPDVNHLIFFSLKKKFLSIILEFAINVAWYYDP